MTLQEKLALLVQCQFWTPFFIEACQVFLVRFEVVERMEACDHLAENNAEDPLRVLSVLLVVLLTFVLTHELFQHLKRVVEEVGNAVFEFRNFLAF
jgi:hypothetical protein